MNLGEGENQTKQTRGEGEPVALGVYAAVFKWERAALAAGKGHPVPALETSHCRAE